MAEIIQYQLSKDANFYPHGIVIYPPKYVNAYVLVANTAQTVTVPTDARVALFSCTRDFYINWQTTAAVPSSNITNGTGPELNPVARDISDYTSFSVISSEDCILTIAYMK